MSCFTFVHVDPETLEVTSKYNTNGGPKWTADDLECLIPFDVLADQAVLVDGVVTLVEDPVKVQARLDTAWASLRAERNRRLAACDWTQLADAHLSQDKKDAWATYRQELRDLPESVTDPMIITTDPTGPSVPWPLDPTQTPPTPVTGSRLESLMSVAV